MATPFAALEAAVNRSALAALANASAVVGGVAVEGVFDARYADPLGIAGATPSLLVQTSAVPAVAIGTPVTVGATAYTVASVEPDGTGLTRLKLEAVA